MRKAMALGRSGYIALQYRSRILLVATELPPDAVLHTVYTDDATEADLDVLEAELVDAAVRLVREHPDVGALVLECTNFVPFSQAIRAAVGVPVFDLYTLVMQSYYATEGQDFPRVAPTVR